jgi:hypothetical protein
MKIVIKINVYSKENPKGLHYEKHYNSEIVPSIGEKIKDSLFAEYKKVIDVIYDFSVEECTIILESKEFPHDRFNGHIQEVAEMHQWTQSTQVEE